MNAYPRMASWIGPPADDSPAPDVEDADDEDSGQKIKQIFVYYLLPQSGASVRERFTFLGVLALVVMSWCWRDDYAEFCDDMWSFKKPGFLSYYDTKTVQKDGTNCSLPPHCTRTWFGKVFDMIADIVDLEDFFWKVLLAGAVYVKGGRGRSVLRPFTTHTHTSCQVPVPD